MTLSVKYYVIFFVIWELHTDSPTSALQHMIEVLSLSLPRGFAGVKRPLGYPCLVRESAPRPVFEGFLGA